VLEIRNLSAEYGKTRVLCGLSETFESGKLTSVIGSNGCGKSTLLKTLIGVLPIADGEIFVDGESLAPMDRKRIAKKIAYLPQGRATPDMTVEQMVLHGRFPHISYPRRYTAHDREIASLAMEKVGISDLAERSLGELSGGMRQTAYIAMALAQDTDYILLDEPTTYLDVSHQIEMLKLLQNLANEGKGIICVMHDLPMAFDFSDKIAVMRDGKIEMSAAPDEMSASSIVKEIFGVEITRIDDGKYFYKYK